MAVKRGLVVPGAVRRFFSGVRLVGGGLKLWVTSPKLMLLGSIPALIVSIALTAGLGIMLFNLDAIATWMTPFAESWATPWQVATRVAAGLVAFTAAAYFGLRTFTTLTLAVGGPFYEHIWRTVEGREGAELPVKAGSQWRAFRRGLANSIRLLGITLASSILFLILGLIPVVGQFLVPVLATMFGGWYLTIELSGFAFDERGYTLRERRRMLAHNRAGALGFGMTVYLLFLVPFGPVLVMPAAVAGATLFGRQVLGAASALSTTPDAGPDTEPGPTQPQPQTPA